MKVNSILLLAIVLFSAAVLVTCQDDAKARANPLLRRVGGRPGAKTSTTPPPPPEEGELGEEDYAEAEEGEGGEGAEEALTTTSSTEPPKKIGPIIRPFRSNDDLLNALKRRQMTAKPGASKPIRPANGGDEEGSSQAAGPVSSSAKSSSKDSGSRRRFGGNSKSAGGEEEGDVGGEVEEGAPKRPSRFNLRSGRR